MTTTVITRTRQQFYDEVWEISAMGIAKRYDIPYAQLLKQLKAANIPIPPSGYWTKINFGKPVEKIPLQGDHEQPVTLFKSGSLSNGTDKSAHSAEQEPSPISVPAETSRQPDSSQAAAPSSEPLCIYDRQTLYKEIWAMPIEDIAKKFSVSEGSLRMVCKSLDIPVPKGSYWTKLRAGKSTAQEPLPVHKTSAKHTNYCPPSNGTQTALGFLGDEEQAVVMAVAAQILLPNEKERMNTQIIRHRQAITEWKRRKNENRQARNAPEPPLMADSISESSVPRACHLMDALIKAMEPLGCLLTDQLKFIINKETVSVSFAEGHDKIEHIPTMEENRKLLEYKEALRKSSYAYKPKIPKYDYPYNGHLSITINGRKTFKDHKGNLLEHRLGDIMLALYKESEALRQQRLAQEEAERIRQEEARKRQELRIQYNQEVERTLALTNMAEDYDIACKIRRYIAAYAAAHPGEDISEWMSWAEEKADWYDPTVARKDLLLGKRDHTKNKDEKTPKQRWY